jgi:ribosome-associated protein
MLDRYRSDDRGWLRIPDLINTTLSGTTAPSFPPLTGSAEFEEGSLVQIVMASLDDAKAEDATLIDLHGKTSIADAMVITTGRSSVHVASIADRVVKALKENGRSAPSVEGLVTGDWVLIDAGDVIVHVFRPEVRQFYNLEKMWGADRPNEHRAV